MKNNVYGYVRVSTKDQNEARQVIAMHEFGVDEQNVFVEKQSGKDFNRPQYKRLLRKLKAGDTLVIKSMGYRRGKNGAPEVVEAEAKIICTIFHRFLEGATPAIIARELNAAGIPCPSRKSLLGEDEIEAAKARKKTARWSPSTIESILTNEKYKGDAILQKTYCTDYIKKTFVVNDGSEIPKYYAQNSHPAIVSTEVFDLMQIELEWRRSLKSSYSGKSCFDSRIICGDCGAFYGSKVWHSMDDLSHTIKHQLRRRENGNIPEES